jgi:hypothetical protein
MKSKERLAIEIVFDGDDCFVIADGLKIAKRGNNKDWIPLEPGWIVACDPYSNGDEMEIVVDYDPSALGKIN